jgi:pyridoxal 5'-phosphate synthase pdxT subunit
MPEEEPLIGVLALQGDVREHVAALERAGARTVPVKTRERLDEVDGLIIPGGESTTIGMLLERFELMEPLRARIESGMPVFGTCAGLILMAREIVGSGQPRIGSLDVAVERNAYGRQVDSFETQVPSPALGEEALPAVFIRAPKIAELGTGVEVLAEADGDPVLVRQDRQLASTFHPELTADPRIHAYFVSMTRDAVAADR